MTMVTNFRSKDAEGAKLKIEFQLTCLALMSPAKTKRSELSKRETNRARRGGWGQFADYTQER